MCGLHNFYDEQNANDFKDHENKIREDEETVKKYMAGVREVKGKLLFALKFSGKCSIKHIKSRVYSWMASNRSYATMDKIKSERITTIGFFTHIHPDFHNRTEFKRAIEQLLEKNNVQEN